MTNKIKVAVLDDYQQAATSFADWSVLQDSCDITFFSDHEFDAAALVKRLLPFQVICLMRERTPVNRELLISLPNLQLIVSTGKRNASLDTKAAEDLGIEIKNTGYVPTGAPEHTWALLMALARHIPQEHINLQEGRWQSTVGTDLNGKTIGIVGLGNIGTKIAAYAKAFDMNVIAWSENLDKEKAKAAGATAVSKTELFRQSDFVTVHLVLSDRSRGLITKDDLNLMKPTAFLINTSRGPLIKEEDLVAILQAGQIKGAALDVFDVEPLPLDHPFRTMTNVLATPHIGYVTEETYTLFFRDIVKIIHDWIIKAA